MALLNKDMLAIFQADWICVVGVSADLCEQVFPLLDADKNKRLVFLDVEGKELSVVHQQMSVFPAFSFQEMMLAAKKIGWKSVLQTLAVINIVENSDLAAKFESAVRRYKEAAHLLLSDWSDVGESVLKHAFLHWNSLPDVRAGLKLKDRFQAIPAVICGGGPSLKKNMHCLDRDKALIFAGGAALSQLLIEPHFAASIDRGGSVDLFKQNSFWQVPFFYQTRMNPKNFSLLHGEKLYIPDGCYPAESWLSNHELFDGGWTVGTFLISLAMWLGCDPIICMGMDLCYEGDLKYPFCDSPPLEKERLIKTEDRDGRTVWTQRDWLMAVDWLAEHTSRRWDKTFINATEGGLRLSGLIREQPLQDVMDSLSVVDDLEGRVYAEVTSLDWVSIPWDRMDEWKRSLKRCLSLCKKGLKNNQPIVWKKEIVYEMLLFPLWQIWGPLFERELEVDGQPISLEEKLRLNQILFFQRVLYEQAN